MTALDLMYAMAERANKLAHLRIDELRVRL